MSEADAGNAAGRKRRWGSSTSVIAKKPSISITTDSLKVLSLWGTSPGVHADGTVRHAQESQRSLRPYDFVFIVFVLLVFDSGHQSEPGGGGGAPPGGAAAVRGRGEPGGRPRRPGQRPQDPAYRHAGQSGLATSPLGPWKFGFLSSLNVVFFLLELLFPGGPE